MSDTYVEPIPRAKSLESAPSRLRIWGRWAARIVVLLVVLWAAGEGVSLAIQHTPLRKVLTSQIEAAMGRPVDVGSYAFSFWSGPAIEARSVSVGEDPRFGAEYFLRADSMAVRLRWQSLLRGRVEFGTLSLTRPSLNLVRSSTGDWNLAEWLPRPAATPMPRSFSGPVLPSMATRFRRIEVEGGRINFKFADEKLPFAFVEVAGTVETDHPGRWRMNLQATPWRAAVVLQQAGTIRVSGDVGGTSSRLRPAALNIRWTDASLSDVLRLARGDDFGVRGALALSIDARTDDSGDGWTTSGRVELRQVHRWDLALRPDNPSLNLITQMAWRPSAPYVELTQAKIEAPHSSVEASGRVYWGREVLPSKPTISPVQVVLSSAEVDAGDLLAWARAFHPGIADNLSVRGLARVNAALADWPPRVLNATVSSEGVDLSGIALRKPVRVGQLQLRYDSGLVSFLPVNVSWGPAVGSPDGLFRIEAATQPAVKGLPVWHLAGSTSQVRDLIAGASDFGWNISRGWDLAGPFACDLRWQSPLDARFVSSMLQPTGWMEFGASGKASGGVALRAPFLNLPVEQIKARVELKPGIRQVKLASAEAFGARWSGTFERHDPAALWQLNLSADRLSAADLDRWLNPRWRESFLGRMLPFLNSRTVASAAPENLRASGRLAIDRFTLAPLPISHLQADLEINGRRIALEDATGQFYGGQVAGSLDANLQAAPSYHADLDFSRVDVAALVASMPNLAGVSAASGSADLSLDARGAARADLVDSLACQGTAHLVGPELQNPHPAGAGEAFPASGRAMRFSSGSAEFSCSQRKIDFQNLTLQGPDGAAEGSGTVDFSRNLDVRLRLTQVSPESGYRTGDILHLTGTLAAPQITLTAPSSAGRSR